MTSTTSTPHDAVFKGLIGQPEHARGVLRSIVPAAVADTIDWQSLTPVPGNFVDLELGQQYTDLLFSARWAEGAETEAMGFDENELLAYLLFEHQSAPPKTRDGPMAYRLLRYQVRIWEQWISRNPEAKALPMIIPIVMYHGRAPWSEARSFSDLLAVPPAVRPAVKRYLVQLEYLLHDLSELTDEELRGRAMTAVAKLVTMCFKHARTHPNFLALFGRWMDVVRQVFEAPNGLSALAQVLCYILQVNKDVTREELQALLVREIGPETEGVIVTTGQQLIEQGIERGIKQGIEQGIEQGHQRGVQATLLKLLRLRFGSQVDARVEQHLAAASMDQLERWTERLLSATTLGELLAS